MPRGGDTSHKARENGSRVGRPAKSRIEQKATKGIASKVLSSEASEHWPGEQARWMELLNAKDERLRFDVLKYLTDRRDGKPAQGVFVGDTRESARDLDFGDLKDFFAAGEPRAAGKPN